MSLKSEGDEEEYIFEKEDECDYTAFSHRCGGCGLYSAELTSMEKLGFCQKCGGLLRPLEPGEGIIASSRRKMIKPKSASSGCMLIIAAVTLISLFGHS